MSLMTIWSPFFQSAVRMSGRTLQLDGKVKRIDPVGEELVRAMIDDNETHTVIIEQDGKQAAADCTCPHFQSGAYCKHVWATLVDVQNSSSGPGASKQDLMRLRARALKAKKRAASAAPRRPKEPEWVTRLSLLRVPSYERKAPTPPVLPSQRQICYVVIPNLSHRYQSLVIELRQRSSQSSGWSKMKPLKVNDDLIGTLSDPIDRELTSLVIGGAQVSEDDDSDYPRGGRPHATFRLPSGAQHMIVQKMIQTSRCFIDLGDDISGPDEFPIHWDDNGTWRLWMVGTEVEDELVINAQLRRKDQTLPIAYPKLIIGGSHGLIYYDNFIAPFDDRDAYRWVSQFREHDRSEDETKTHAIHIPNDDINRFLERLYMLPQLPEIDLPAGFGREERHVEPKPHLDLFSPGTAEASAVLNSNARNQLAARVWFEYDGRRIYPSQAGRFVPMTPGTLINPPEDAAEATPPDEDPNAIAITAAPDTRAEAFVTPESPEDPAAIEGDEEVIELPPQGVLIRRDRKAERDAIAQLATCGLRQANAANPDMLLLPYKQMAFVVTHLMSNDWIISADRLNVRTAGPPNLSIASNVDWFELRGTVKYHRADGEEQEVSLPEILAAARNGESMITLGDGSQGLLPEQWLDEHGLLTAMGELEDDHLRFKASQAALLDSLLDERELVSVDEQFKVARDQLKAFEGIKPLDPAPGKFHGTLRPYQREGLGWFKFLRTFGMNGILADDMGLGKTVQVLSMLEARYLGIEDHIDQTLNGEKPKHRPTLVVVPRSVVFNWIDEAEKFTPDLRVMAYAGADRIALRNAFDDHDVIVTSFGLMRRDVEELQHYHFDYIVLDEAQAIKNPASQSAKSARLLRSNHRLALTGTPIENHLGDLWSIFEYLNPGMLGSNARFADIIRQGSRVTQKEEDSEENEAKTTMLQQIASSLRPFILRRTKAQVLTDLPPKTEQTILCHMEPEQRKVYDDMRSYYRQNLMKQLDSSAPSPTGSAMGKSTFMVLEALLRLRQAACHPGLIDEARADEASAKLDVLLERVADIIEEGSKALVFSQFTSMLSLVRRKLDERGIPYCYLDGQTRNRREVVEKFQTDEKIPLFLISLKTGGLGLNLTAAEYVFILDPWWNPAVEAQAIDRTYRIGQTKPVFAYRMICEDTVEQRIAEMQDKKRKLADAIVGGEENILRSLTRDDLEKLLS
ncbi:ATP-dependent helicase HepA [Poriferisphaera corsica]|uniref:ATP-dependent helicase HepA n=1 Tax=Poriferisphaera corsica TaxID=2528020 RepID=A0A517YQ23_9BACT|nr:DEAD/DEAH box helicase [Poriferisphaera corsica]QDU32312.1 ATP-dependent helicase HepA [Poriferisphaera corsica]